MKTKELKAIEKICPLVMIDLHNGLVFCSATGELCDIRCRQKWYEKKK